MSKKQLLYIMCDVTRADGAAPWAVVLVTIIKSELREDDEYYKPQPTPLLTALSVYGNLTAAATPPTSSQPQS